MHHVVEHILGGHTELQNGVLICPECHANRSEMQRLMPHFREYLERIYAAHPQQVADIILNEPTDGAYHSQRDSGIDNDENNPSAGGRLKIVINWGALDVDRETQTIIGDTDSETIVKLLVELIGTFGKSMKQQLTEFPVIRYPLSAEPTITFLNRARGTPFSFLQVPTTDLYFCPQSSRAEKVERLRKLFSRLTLPPDQRGLPPDSVEVSIDAGPQTI